MADNSKIEWTDATVNFWWGCTKVGPGCDHCYAEAWDKRTGGSHWGLNAPRRKIASAIKLLHRLDNNYAEWAADRECIVGNAKAFGLPIPNMGLTRRVLIQSMSDLFDIEVPLEWFAEGWRCIEICDRLDIQIVTKRVSVVAKRLAEIGCTRWPKQAGLIISVVNQDEAIRDIPRLMALKTKFLIPWVGLSCEPLLGPINLKQALQIDAESGANYAARRTGECLDWVIVGGESGPGARPMHPTWPRSLRDQCEDADIPFLFKQWGEWLPGEANRGQFDPRPMHAYRRCDNHSYEWPKNGEVQNFGSHPDKFSGDFHARRVGKKTAGRLLDGVEYNGFPQGSP